MELAAGNILNRCPVPIAGTEMPKNSPFIIINGKTIDTRDYRDEEEFRFHMRRIHYNEYRTERPEANNSRRMSADDCDVQLGGFGRCNSDDAFEDDQAILTEGEMLSLVL